MKLKKRFFALPLFRVRMGPLFAWVCIHKSPLGSMNVIRCFAEDTHWHNTLHLSCQQPRQLFEGVWWRNLCFWIQRGWGVGVIKQKPLVIFSLSHFVTQLSIFWLFVHFFFFFTMPRFGKGRGQSSKSGQREQWCLCRMCVLIFWTLKCKHKHLL